MKKFGLVCSVLLFFATASSRVAEAQDITRILTGVAVDVETDEPISGVNVLLTSIADSTWRRGMVSGFDGLFSVVVPRSGFYKLQASFIGFELLERVVAVGNANKNLGHVALTPGVLEMDNVMVEAMQQRVEVRGDTTVFNAAAFKVNQDASAEDLVGKLPGVVVEDGTVEAQGEAVTRVLVDGREFFGDDPTAALRNLPSEVIDRVEVYDRASDQAQFTGFDNGDTEKTINIITLPGRSNGQFGKVYGGYGTEERYIGGGSVHMFNGDQRFSFIGLTNNVNQQNFTSEDLLGVVGNAGRRGSGGGGGARLGGSGGRRGAGGGGQRGGGGGGTPRGGQSSSPSNFLTSNSGGINQTNAFGLNYIDSWGEKTAVTGSYFFSDAANESLSLVDRTYFLTDESSQFYNEKNEATSDNYNHRVTMRITHKIDDKNSLIFTPRLSFQNNDSESYLTGLNTEPNGDFLSSTVNDFFSNNSGYTASGNMLFRHAFEKRGRTLSLNVSTGINDRSGETFQLSENRYAIAPDSIDVVDQRSTDGTDGYNVSPSLTYTEPIGGSGQLQIRYRPSWSVNQSQRLVKEFDELTDDYTQNIATLSSQIETTEITQRAGFSYNVRKGKVVASAGLDYQSVTLGGDQTLPTLADLNKTYTGFLPSFNAQVRFSNSNNIRFTYRTSTNNPSVTQLQDVVDNTNPLQLSAGNSALEQSYSNSMSLRYNVSNTQKGTVLVAFASALISSNYIGSETRIAEQDELLPGGILFPQGSQLIRPVNLDGQWNVRSFLNYGLPVSLIKSNVNISTGYTYANTPGMINGEANTSEVQTVTGGAVIGSNISTSIDFTVNYRINYNVVRNSLYPELNNNYADHRVTGKIDIRPLRQLVLNSSLSYRFYTGEVETIGSVSPIWNAGIGYKFLQGNGGELKLGIADILDQSVSQGRTINEFYIEDNSSNTLGRYVMLSFTYTLRNYSI